jgi:hypothetical protein
MGVVTQQSIYRAALSHESLIQEHPALVTHKASNPIGDGSFSAEKNNGPLAEDQQTPRPSQATALCRTGPCRRAQQKVKNKNNLRRVGRRRADPGEILG